MPTRFLLTAILCAAALAEPRAPSGSGETRRAIERLRTLGSVLMIAAHPDDENTALLAYFAKGRNLRTGYLSLTRGEGGQNLIGSEQGELMGLIRTQELLMARRIDGAEQFFTRVIDFGFTKTVDETLAKWGGEEALGDVVRVIRRFQPDVVVLRFSGTPRDGHGQHQASAMLGRQAFLAASDPARFPTQQLAPWKAKRLLYNMPGFTRQMQEEAAKTADKIELDVGEFDPLSGFSYGEIAGMSRSLHRSQAMGAPERKGSMRDFLRVIEGEPARDGPFDGIETTWNRVAGGEAVEEALAQAARSFDAARPQASVPALIEARRRMASLKGPWPEAKLREADEAIAQAAGLALEAVAPRATFAPGASVELRATAIARARGVEASVVSVSIGTGRGEGSALEYNKPATWTLRAAAPARYSQPFWLEKPLKGARYDIADPARIGAADDAPPWTAEFALKVAGQDLRVWRPVIHRYVEAARGELARMPVVAPPVAVEFAERALVFPSIDSREVTVQVRANRAGASGELAIEAPAGWSVAPASAKFALEDDGEVAALKFRVTPPAAASVASLAASAKIDGVIVRHGMRTIEYDHIPPRTVFPEAVAKVVRTGARVLARNVGYVMGAGDDVPRSLRQLGCEVTLLGADDLASGDLSRFDAIVTGVRAYNTRKDLRANQQRLFDWVSKGGTLVVQYNVPPGGFMGGDPALLSKIGPYPLKTGSGRITVEEAAMRPLKPDHPLLQAPNRIEPADYEGWIQERGLYFASDFDPRYEAIWEMSDPGEKPQQGGTLYTRHGEGVYVFTPLAWFRQLPAGVPGAYRIFANILSAGKVR